MDTANIKQLKTELASLDRSELIPIVLRLAKFKKENKELLTYLLFDCQNENGYIKDIQHEMDAEFERINTTSYFYIKKSVRKILKMVKNHIRYTSNKETEIVLLLYFCKKLRCIEPSITKNQQLVNILFTQIKLIERKIATLHKDLQYDYQLLIENLKS